jgi:hypothetical protein
MRRVLLFGGEVKSNGEGNFGFETAVQGTDGMRNRVPRGT